MRRLAINALALVLSADAEAWAETPSCTAEAAGIVACMAGRLCSCGFARGSPTTGLPDGFRWDCSLLRPSCKSLVPATLNAWQGDLPELLEIDRSNTIIGQGVTKPQGQTAPLRW